LQNRFWIIKIFVIFTFATIMIDINITTAVIIIIVVVDINVDFSLLLFSLYNEPHETRRPSVGARQ